MGGELLEFTKLKRYGQRMHWLDTKRINEEVHLFMVKWHNSFYFLKPCILSLKQGNSSLTINRIGCILLTSLQFWDQSLCILSIIYSTKYSFWLLSNSAILSNITDYILVPILSWEAFRQTQCSLLLRTKIVLRKEWPSLDLGH